MPQEIDEFEEDEICNEFVYFNIPATKKELKLVLDVFLLELQLFKNTGLIEDIPEDDEKIQVMVARNRVEDFKKFIEENEIKCVKEEE